MIKTREVKYINGSVRPSVVTQGWVKYIRSMSIDKKDWINVMYYNAKKRAAKKGIEFAIDYTEMVNMLIKTQGVCSVSGIPFSFEKPEGARTSPFIPSIDRVNSSMGYTTQNCRIVCYCINLAMSQWGEPILEQIATSFFYSKTSSIYNNRILRCIQNNGM